MGLSLTRFPGNIIPSEGDKVVEILNLLPNKGIIDDVECEKLREILRNQGGSELIDRQIIDYGYIGIVPCYIKHRDLYEQFIFGLSYGSPNEDEAEVYLGEYFISFFYLDLDSGDIEWQDIRLYTPSIVNRYTIASIQNNLENYLTHEKELRNHVGDDSLINILSI